MPRPVTSPTFAFQAGVSGTPPSSSWARASRAPRPMLMNTAAAATRARPCFGLLCLDTVAMLPQFYRRGDSVGPASWSGLLWSAGCVPGFEGSVIFLRDAARIARCSPSAAQRHATIIDAREHNVFAAGRRFEGRVHIWTGEGRGLARVARAAGLA